MNPRFLSLCLLLLIYSCDQTTQLEEGSLSAQIVPIPKEIHPSSQILLLTEESKLFSPDSSLLPLLELLATDLEQLTDVKMGISSQSGTEADIILALDNALGEEEHSIRIAESIELKGGSYAALAQAKSSLIQLAQTKDGKLAFPVLELRDYPDAGYRGLLIDLARKWHSFESVKQLVDLAAYYKINFLQLHFTDYQSYTLPSRKYPKLSSPNRHYSFEELRELEAYAKERGVIIIPEIDIPGHSSPFVRKYPEIFALQDTSENPWIIHMGREKVYEALDEIIGEMIGIFASSPYFHIGGDEAIFRSVDKDPEVQAYMAANKLGTDVHELYRHFLVRMNQIVKKHGKQMCVWEGFRPEGEVPIPKDLIVFEFETNRYLPGQLIEDGYTVVNTSWKPLYVVNQKKWEPRTIYNWNLWRWENWWDKAPSFQPIQLEKTPLIIGAQMCAWEQAEESEFPSLRQRLPTFVERIWNTEQMLSFDEFRKSLENADQRLSQLLGDARQDSLLWEYNFSKDLLP